MSADPTEKPAVGRLKKLCDAAARLLAERTEPAITMGSSSATTNWRWDIETTDRDLGRGTVRIRLSRHGGVHRLSLHEESATRPLTRITEDERLAPVVPVAPSKASLLETITRMRNALTCSRSALEEHFVRLCAALVTSAHPSSETFKIVRTDHHQGISIESYDRNGTTMRRWSHPERPCWGTLSQEAIDALAIHRSSPPILMIHSGGLSGRSRLTSCRIEPHQSVHGIPEDPLERLRMVAGLPSEARLVPPIRI